MKILIITTYFPPDSAIGGVRPYMFAKYLTKFGHDVTVIRSGKLLLKPDESYRNVYNFKVFSYLGNMCDAARFENDKNFTYSKQLKFNYLPNNFKNILKTLYNFLFKDFKYLFNLKQNFQYYKLIKCTIENNYLTDFDIVFTTSGEISNAFAGEYIKKKFHCKWVMDFRDLYLDKTENYFVANFIKHLIERKYVELPDAVTCVSKGMVDIFTSRYNCIDKCKLIYNGYDDICIKNDIINNNKLVFCYTGMLNKYRIAALKSLLRCFKYIAKRYNIINIEFKYAGNNFVDIYNLFKAYSLEYLLSDCGYLSKSSILDLQSNSDVFVALNVNTQCQKGYLSGKFFEGIRAKKPILFLVSGNLPNSEMYNLNLIYKFGYVYECCREEIQFDGLCDFVIDLYNQKLIKGKIDYHPNKKLFNDFRYDNLAKQLEKICFDLLKNE